MHGRGDLEGRVVVVTGGARGIGRAIAARLLEEAATVVIGDLDGGAAARTAAELDPDRASGRAMDVTDWDAVHAFASEVLATHGRLDAWVNNAGVQLVGDAIGTTANQWRAVMAVDLDGVFVGCQAAARVMGPRGGGAIVNLASVAGVVALPRRAPYVTAKAAVIGMTRTLAVEWAPLAIRVNAIAPGWVLTDMVREVIDHGHLDDAAVRAATPLGRLGEMHEIADAAAYLASDRSSYVTGQTLVVDGGYSVDGGIR